MKRGLLAACLAFFSFGCDDDGGAQSAADAGGCETHDECGEGLVCVSSTCVLPQCTVDEECREGLACVDFRCSFVGDEADGGGGGTDAGAPDPEGDAAPPPRDAGSDDDAFIPPPDRDAEPRDDDAGPLAEDAMVDAPPAPECVDDVDCPADRRCAAGVCVARCDAEGVAPCEDGLVCDPGTGRCVAERRCDPPCGRGFACDPLEGRCVGGEIPCGGACEDGLECDEETDRCVREGCAEDGFAGNDVAERAAELDAGESGRLALCVPDWFALEVPEGVEGRLAGLRVVAEFEAEQGNLEMTLHDAEENLVAEATTDRSPEVLRVDQLQAGTYRLRVFAWSPAPPTPVIDYRLRVEVAADGFCALDAECGDGRLCEADRCVDAGPCGGCPPLTECDEARGECVEACVADAFEGTNDARNRAAAIEPGRIEALTLCTGEEDWFLVNAEEGETITVRAVGEGPELDLEVWAPPPREFDPEELPLAQSATVGIADEQVELRADRTGGYFVRVFFGDGIQYALDVAVGSACQFDWDCCPDDDPDCGQRCDGVRGTCVPTSCAADPPDFVCEGGQVCDPESGRCVPPPCEDDRFVGNHGPDEARRLADQVEEEGLQVCPGAPDWYALQVSAGDGIQAAIRFADPDRTGALDLELRDADDRVLIASLSTNDDESLAYNVDAEGTYFLRVFGAQRSYRLEAERVRGGIDPLVCGAGGCGFRRVCVEDDEPAVCLVETCAGPEPTVECPEGFQCEQATGACRCPLGDRFEEQNSNAERAAPVEAAEYDALTLCGEEEDWYRIEVPEGATLVGFLEFPQDRALSLSAFDAALGFVGDADEAAPGREVLREAVPEAGLHYLVVSGRPPFGPVTYTLRIAFDFD